MKKTKEIHPGYEEFARAKTSGLKISQLFGKWHYFYETEKGVISLISIKKYYNQKGMQWEILSLKGNLFEDVMTFSTKKEAEKEIYKLLK